MLDASDVIGNGSPTRNGGVRQSGRDPREPPLTMYAVRNMWPRLSEELGADVEYCQGGNLRLGKTERHIKILDGPRDKAVAQGLDMRMISGDEVRQINPYLSDEVIGASWCPTDGHANPFKATYAYYMAARRLGVRFYTGMPVTELRKVHGRVRKVVCPEATFEGESVIVCAGYASRKVLASVGIDVPMSNVLIEALVTDMEPKMFPQMLGTADADFYGHQTKHGSFVSGGDSGLEEVNKDNGLDATSSITAPAICRGILRYIPKLANAKIVRTWGDYEGVCIDGVPVLDTIRIKGRDRRSLDSFVSFVKSELPSIRSIEVADTIEEAVRGADIVSFTTTASDDIAGFPKVDGSWIKPGAREPMPSAALFDEDFLLKSRLVVDNMGLYEAWEEYPYPTFPKMGIIGRAFTGLVHEGKIDRSSIVGITDVITGKLPGRASDDQTIVYSVGGMPVEDIAWGGDVYHRAKEPGIGKELELWGAPAMF